jgi:hypothetical protein
MFRSPQLSEAQMKIRFAAMLAPVFVLLVAFRSDPVPAAAPVLHVVKSPTCGCCQAWVDYMKAQGFTVTVENRETFTQLKRQNGVTAELESCHTAFVDGLVVEGHVPADLVKKLLRDKPNGVKGVAVPGMPRGSPGMEAPVHDRYTVYTFDAAGRKTAYAQR